jgi:hypothetical protein
MVMFPLSKRKTGGFGYGDKTWYTAHHLGQDYTSLIGNKLYAPFDGIIKTTLTGEQGGLTIWCKPNHDNVIMRFMHLSAFKCKAGQKVKEGDLIGLTGNTGKSTTGAHLHLDISKKAVNLANWKNFVDPEKYEWIKEPKPTKNEQVAPVTTEEVKIPVQVIVAPQATPEVRDIIKGEGVAYTASPDLSKVGQILSNAEPTLQERVQAFFEAVIKFIKK